MAAIHAANVGMPSAKRSGVTTESAGGAAFLARTVEVAVMVPPVPVMRAGQFDVRGRVVRDAPGRAPEDI